MAPRTAAGLRTTWLTVGGLRIRCLAADTIGPPVLLLHGGGFDAADFSYCHVFVPLARAHRVFALDLPGYGQSDKPDLDYNLDYYIRFVGCLLDALNLRRASLVGLSMGGGAALGFALQSPERVDKLVLVASYGLGNDVPLGHLGYLVARTQRPADLVYWLMSRSRRALRWGLCHIVYNRQVVTEELIEEAYCLLRCEAAGTVFGTFRKNEVSWDGLRTDFSTRLSELRCPTLLIHGSQDRVVPVAWTRRAHISIPGSELHVLHGCGHWAPRECPRMFNRVVTSFLKPASASTSAPLDRL